ncbi:BrnT family toxin [[Haemophilus] felis]|nr:BrnT family toxin [[Haemophilus] felis]
MKIEFDSNKSEKNSQERGLPFDDVKAFDWQTAVIIPDVRFDYPEPRLTATGFIDERLYVICFTPIVRGIRVISFRKANKREVKKYEQQKSFSR